MTLSWTLHGFAISSIINTNRHLCMSSKKGNSRRTRLFTAHAGARARTRARARLRTRQRASTRGDIRRRRTRPCNNKAQALAPSRSQVRARASWRRISRESAPVGLGKRVRSGVFDDWPLLKSSATKKWATEGWRQEGRRSEGVRQSAFQVCTRRHVFTEAERQCYLLRSIFLLRPSIQGEQARA